jgi:hypothetical protein
MILPKHYPPADTSESNCRLNAVRRWHNRYSPLGDYNQANTRRCGVFRVKILTALRVIRATMSRAQV